MEPLSVAAGVVGIVVPALHGTRILLDGLQRIIDAPKAVESLNAALTSIDTVLQSLQSIDVTEWHLFGDSVLVSSKTAIEGCKNACENFRSELLRWTKRSRDGRLSWRTRAKIGFFKEHQVQAMSEHLQTCKITCTLVFGVATL